MDEGRDEQPDRELARLVAEDPLHDPRRELPIASWTTTIVIVSTSAARLTIETAIVVKIAVAEVGRPTSPAGSPVVEGPVERDGDEGDRRARSTHMTGTNQRLEPTLTVSFRNPMRRELPRAPTTYA